jgi:hypothetical protein
MALKSSLNPDVIKSGLDKLFYPEFDLPSRPEIADANDPDVFMQMDSTKASETLEEFQGVGAWVTRNEEDVADEAQPQSKYSTTFTNGALAKGVKIPKRFWDDDQHNMVELMIQNFAERGRSSRDKDAFSVFRNGFTTTYGDSQYLFDTDHPTTPGSTASNKATVKLSEGGLQTVIVQMEEMADRDGEISGRVINCILVPPYLFKKGSIILDSKLRSGTANNDANFYSDKYGILLKKSQWLGAAAGGHDDYWYALARHHGIIRFNREEINTRMIPWEKREDRCNFYDGEFRQSVGAISYVGAIGSDGSTGSYDA